MNDMKQLLSKRGQANVKELPFLMHAHFSALGDMFSEKNPDGHINLGTAENRLIDQIMIDLLGKVHTRLKLTGENIHYNLFHGAEYFRKAIADYWQKVWLGPDNQRKIDGKNIVVTCGCSEALEMLAYGLCNPGEAILIPRPYYSGFVHDIQSRAGVIPVGVKCGTEMSVEAFEKALDEQKKKGLTVRAVLFSSPNNPLGHVYSEQAIKNVISFCMANNLDIISDEIYAQTIYDPNVTWVSTLKLVPEEYKHRVHVTGGFAKDFTLSGFRVGFFHSYNSALVNCGQEISYFSCVSSHTQALLAELMRAPELPEVIKTSKAELYKAHNYVIAMLGRHGIKATPGQAGIFILVDMRRYMKGDSPEAEIDLWRHLYEQYKINMSPGALFEAEDYGIFRICFAHPTNMMEELDKRFERLAQLNAA